MKFNNLPIILSLIAGFVVCIATFIYGYDDISWILLVLLAIVLFYILGLCARKLFSVILKDDEGEEDGNDGEITEQTEEQPQENVEKD